MIIVWSSADETTLNKVVAPVLRGAGLPNRVESNTQLYPPTNPGDVVMACGTKALNVLQEMGLVPKGRTVTSQRETPIQHNGATIFISFDPGLASRDYERLPEIQWDFQLGVRYYTKRTTKPVTGEYRFVESLNDLIEYIEAEYERTGKPVDYASDLETKSFNPYNPEAWIIACSFTVKEGYSDVLYFHKGERPTMPPPDKPEASWTYYEALWMQLNWIFTTPKASLRGANYKFDSNWEVHKWGITVTNQRFDTMLVGSLLDENRSNSLKLHAKIMTTMGGYEDDMDKYDFGSLELVPPEELLQYVGGDSDATYRVAKVMKRDLLKDKKLSNFYVKLLQPSAKVFEKVERNGLLIDQEYFAKLQRQLDTEIRTLQHGMLSCLPNKLKIKHRESIANSVAEGKSPFTPAILREFLFTKAGLNLKPKVFTPKSKEASTAVDHLMMFNDDPVAANFIQYFKKMGSAQKTQSTFVVGFLKHLRADGRFHPSYMLHRGDYDSGGTGSSEDSGANTGRTSAKDPAVQTIPKHSDWAKTLRKGYIAPPGKVVLQLDFSQGELRIAAVVAEEPTMINAYAGGMDLHSITAARLSGYEMDEFMLLPEEVRDELRSGGKAGNFGLLYGMGEVGFQTYALNSYGVKLTDQQSHDQREAFFELYSRLPQWHKEAKAFARNWGFVRSPLGRVRHLPLINSRDREVAAKSERQAVNSQIQSCLSDMMQLSMVHIDREYGDSVEMCLMCHDSIAAYVPEDEALIWAKRLKDILENLPLERDFGWNSALKFVADAEVGPSFAELKKLKNL